MLELRIITAGTQMPIFDLPAALGHRSAYREIGDTIEGLIAFMDALQGDIDLEDGGDDEPDADAMGDVSYTEWHTRGRHKTTRGAEQSLMRPDGLQALEDDEDDDPDTSVEDNPAGFDPEEDFGAEERGEAEEGHEDDVPEARLPHRDRIRRTRCVHRRVGILPNGWYEYTLREGSRLGGVVIG
ncbi:hypothetical protein [Sphingomonas sp. PB4P5]|uniref:hypothetical protein n=1 Tax=Parasphingomonas puruogangriensis TaxID=3096155 RepID=UPI002FCA0760